MSRPYKKDPTRLVNAIIAALLAAFFLIHAGLAAAKLCGVDLGETFKWTVWVGVGIIALHVILSLRTTQTMFNDTERPPSAKKRQHQMLKWLTGGVLILAVLFHFPSGEGASFAYALALIITAAALSWHIYTGTKSLTRDLNLPSSLRPIVRAIVCLAAAAIAAALITASYLAP